MSIEKSYEVLKAEEQGKNLANIRYKQGFADGYYQAMVDVLGKEEADKRQALKDEWKQKALDDYLKGK